MKPYIPEIRIISVDHERTTTAEPRLRHALDRHGFKQYPVLAVFCHLEAGRCGVPAGKVGVEVDGVTIWMGPELTEDLAEQFCAGLGKYVERRKLDLGMA